MAIAFYREHSQVEDFGMIRYFEQSGIWKRVFDGERVDDTENPSQSKTWQVGNVIKQWKTDEYWVEAQGFVLKGKWWNNTVETGVHVSSWRVRWRRSQGYGFGFLRPQTARGHLPVTQPILFSRLTMEITNDQNNLKSSHTTCVTRSRLDTVLSL